jgi:plastocyanin
MMGDNTTPKNNRKISVLISILVVACLLMAGKYMLGYKWNKNVSLEKTEQTVQSSEVPNKIDLYQARVDIYSWGLNAKTVKVSTGDSVAWVVKDRSGHKIATSDGPVQFSGQGVLGFGDMYMNTFSKAGTYNYYDTVNPELKGVVIVE